MDILRDLFGISANDRLQNAQFRELLKVRKRWKKELMKVFLRCSVHKEWRTVGLLKEYARGRVWKAVRCADEEKGELI